LPQLVKQAHSSRRRLRRLFLVAGDSVGGVDERSFGILIWLRLWLARRGLSDSIGRRRPGVSRAGCPGSRRVLRRRQFAGLGRSGHRRNCLIIPATNDCLFWRGRRRPSVCHGAGEQSGLLIGSGCIRLWVIVRWLTVARVTRKSKTAGGAEFRAWPARRSTVGTALHHTLP
jgi:hypothetical protein